MFNKIVRLGKTNWNGACRMVNLPIPQSSVSSKVKRYADKISSAWQKAG